MEHEKIIAGLDIGTTKVCIVVGKQSKQGKLEVLGSGEAASDGVVRGIIVNMDKAAMSIKKALCEAEEDAGINIHIVNVGISGRRTTSVQHQGSITRDSIEEEIRIEDIRKLTNDMYRILTPPGNEIIHAIPQDYLIDYEITTKDPVGMSGVRLEANFHIVTAKTNVISNIYKCIKKVGVEIEILMLSSLASSLAVLSDEEKEAGVCLVDIGGGVINIAIFHDAIICHTAVIPFGSNVITSDIKQGCMVMEHQAELLKIKFGKVIPNECIVNELVTIPGLRNRAAKEVSIYNLAQIVYARVEEIIDMIHSEIMISGFKEKLIGGIVMTGGGAQLESMRQLTTSVTGLETRIGLPNEHVEATKMETMFNPSYATGVGLTLSSFKSLDYREAYYKASKEIAVDNAQQNKKKRHAKPFSLSKIFNKTKSFLIDDYDDK